MSFEELTNTSGEWLRGTGPEADIVISSRVRLARNLANFPFVGRATERQKDEIKAALGAAMEGLEGTYELRYVDVVSLNDLDRQFLVERQLISREHAAAEGSRGVAFAPEENVSIMINEEDHLRIQVMLSGYDLERAWQEIDSVDDRIEQVVTYAFNPQLGYLTACPTNVGTGIRASVMLHLPALVMTKQIEKVFHALSKVNLAVRGLYGEGTQASGDFYQISNQVTLGKSETEIINNIGSIIPEIIKYERKARDTLVSESEQNLHDRVSRAYGLLKTARTISSEETMHLLSSVRMGINLGLIGDIAIPTVNELFIHTQPAHLQKIRGSELQSEERNVARANYLRQRLTSDN